MADTYSSEKRSSVMSKIRSKDTKPEVAVRRFLFKNNFRFRIHVKKLPGNPDVVLSKYRTAIFVNGCFWHAHEHCRFNRLPKSRQDYWIPKLINNVARDKDNIQQLTALGWKVITIWECELRKHQKDTTLVNLINELNQNICNG